MKDNIYLKINEMEINKNYKACGLKGDYVGLNAGDSNGEILVNWKEFNEFRERGLIITISLGEYRISTPVEIARWRIENET